MPTAVHHVQIFTRSRDTLVAFLQQSLGLPRKADIEMPLAHVAELMGWKAGEGRVASTLLGSGAAGLVEVIEWPQAEPFFSEESAFGAGAQFAFSVEDVAECVCEARRLGASHVIGPRIMSAFGTETWIATFRLDGVRFQLTGPVVASEQPCS